MLFIIADHRVMQPTVGLLVIQRTAQTVIEHGHPGDARGNITQGRRLMHQHCRLTIILLHKTTGEVEVGQLLQSRRKTLVSRIR